jgi:DNA-binding NarL/FixJ family response regulator
MLFPSPLPASTEKNAASLVIVEDYPLIRDALAQWLNNTPGFTVIAAVGDAQGARECIRQHQPDVVLLDLMLGGIDSLALIAELAGELPGTKFLVLSMMNEALYAERAMRAGAVGYVMKTAETAEVVNALKTVLDGRIYLSPKIFVRMFRGLLKRSSRVGLPGAEGLSDRELQVFQMIGTGLQNREIAEQLKLSVKTVETHRENLKNKLGFQDGADLKNAAVTFVNSMVA